MSCGTRELQQKGERAKGPGSIHNYLIPLLLNGIFTWMRWEYRLLVSYEGSFMLSNDRIFTGIHAINVPLFHSVFVERETIWLQSKEVKDRKKKKWFTQRMKWRLNSVALSDMHDLPVSIPKRACTSIAYLSQHAWILCMLCHGHESLLSFTFFLLLASILCVKTFLFFTHNNNISFFLFFFFISSSRDDDLCSVTFQSWRSDASFCCKKFLNSRIQLLISLSTFPSPSYFLFLFLLFSTLLVIGLSDGIFGREERERKEIIVPLLCR